MSETTGGSEHSSIAELKSLADELEKDEEELRAELGSDAGAAPAPAAVPQG